MLFKVKIYIKIEGLKNKQQIIATYFPNAQCDLFACTT